MSRELQKGQILNLTFCGKEVVLFRTESGKACLTDAYCPHMGAHLGHGGKVLGEEIQCPFHGFRFDCQGNCTASGYGTKAPPKAILQSYHVVEINQMIIAFHHHSGEVPDWFIPDLKLEEFGTLNWTTWDLKSHPQETTENSVDVGHFNWIHGYEQVDQDEEPCAENEVLKLRYSFTRNGKEFGKRGNIRVHIKVDVYGLGYSVVDSRVPAIGLHAKNFVLPTPVKDDQIKLTIGLAFKPWENPSLLHPLAVLVPRPILHRIIDSIGMKAYKKDVSDDFKIWKNKVYIEKPALAKGDGPIPLYRKWAKQFYDEQFV